MASLIQVKLNYSRRMIGIKEKEIAQLDSEILGHQADIKRILSKLKRHERVVG